MSWQEYPECPYCGAIQEPPDDPQSVWIWACQACNRGFLLEVHVTTRYRATPRMEADQEKGETPHDA